MQAEASLNSVSGRTALRGDGRRPATCAPGCPRPQLHWRRRRGRGLTGTPPRPVNWRRAGSRDAAVLAFEEWAAGSRSPTAPRRRRPRWASRLSTAQRGVLRVSARDPAGAWAGWGRGPGGRRRDCAGAPGGRARRREGPPRHPWARAARAGRAAPARRADPAPFPLVRRAHSPASARFLWLRGAFICARALGRLERSRHVLHSVLQLVGWHVEFVGLLAVVSAMNLDTTAWPVPTSHPSCPLVLQTDKVQRSSSSLQTLPGGIWKRLLHKF